MSTKITIYISDSSKEKLQNLAVQQDRSLSYIARQIIEAHLAESEPPEESPEQPGGFQIGNRIKLIKTPKGKRPSIIGRKGTIAGFSKGKYSIKLDSGSSCEVGADWIELI